MTFDQWWANQDFCTSNPEVHARNAWIAATMTEREACAKVCEQLQDDARKNIDWFLSDFFAGSEGGMCAEAIRARNW